MPKFAFSVAYLVTKYQSCVQTDKNCGDVSLEYKHAIYSWDCVHESRLCLMNIIVDYST